ncbi:YjfB family protein [Paenibacillus chartarius]|uniref:YjfB family protein n=1 Tax=Paenibacillus chartarius TaxID=747481 RepID=A0ABV6DGE6_9BACL
MDVAALSISLSQSALSQNVGIRLLQMAKEQSQLQASSVVQMLERSVQPHLGGQLDIRA